MISPAARQSEAKPAPHLTLVQAPGGKQLSPMPNPLIPPHSWQSATADYRKLYSQDGRWARGLCPLDPGNLWELGAATKEASGSLGC